jgi:hypothetical protein
MPITHIGICNIINWDSVINDCDNNFTTYIEPINQRGDSVLGVDSILDMWDNAGYKTVNDGGTVAWDMFLPGEHFDQTVIDQFVEYFQINEYKTAWISRINIGRFAPIHWDVDDSNEPLDDSFRYHCHIGKPQWGHTFIVENQCFYGEQQGSTYRWDSRKYWHAGTNCGLTPKYLFNLW